MATGELRVERNKHGEVVFRVHRWPLAGKRFYICSSVCAKRERTSVREAWRRGHDVSLSRRLAVRDRGRTSGRAKGRVLYYFDRPPLHEGYRMAAAALLHLDDEHPLQILDFCFREDLHSDDQTEAVGWLIRCSYKLARSTNHRRGCLEMRVAPGQDPGEICKAHGFTDVRQDRQESWVRRCPVR